MKKYKLLLFVLFALSSFLNANPSSQEKTKKIIYLNNDMSIPFWEIMSKGIKSEFKSPEYEFEIYDAQNNPKKELELTIKAIKEKVSGVIVSPSNSSACVTILKLLNNANIPVVISDIGTDSGEYISYISSDNKTGAYNIGKVLANKMIEKGYKDGKVGIVAISQKRLNGQARTTGFMKALDEKNIKGAAIKQLKDWTQEETYTYVQDMISNNPKIKAIWLQTSSIYKGALKALKQMDKNGDILLIAFDAEPEFLELIPQGELLGSGMQQPYLMGKEAALALSKHLKRENVEKNIQVPILTITTDNIKEKLPLINLNVLGIE